MNNLSREGSESFAAWVRSLDKIEYSKLASQGKLLTQWEKINNTYLDSVKNSKKKVLNLLFLSGVFLMVGSVFLKALNDSAGNIVSVLSGIVLTIWLVKTYPYYMKYYNFE